MIGYLIITWSLCNNCCPIFRGPIRWLLHVCEGGPHRGPLGGTSL